MSLTSQHTQSRLFKIPKFEIQKCQNSFHILNLGDDLSHLFKIYVKINSKKIKIFC